MEIVAGLDELMKQRVIGALVILALAVIILPMLLNLDGEYTVDNRSQIPTRPDIVAVQIPSSEPIADNKGTKNADQMFRFNDSREEAKNKVNNDISLEGEAPGLTSEGVPKSWILQVGSFIDSNKAKSLTGQLQADQYRAYSRRSTTDGKPIYRVYVGPKILKKDMLDEKTAIERKYKVKTLLLRFEP
jgi:DedD protein